MMFEIFELNDDGDKMKKYNFWIGLWKTIKNSAVLLVPFALALLAQVPTKYAWIAGPVIYLLKNAYQNRTK